METLLSILIITASIVYIINHSGIVVSISKTLFNFLNPDKVWMGQLIPKPFSCAICMSFWVVLIIALFSGAGIIYSIGIASLMSLTSILIDRTILVIIRLINLIK